MTTIKDEPKQPTLNPVQKRAMKQIRKALARAVFEAHVSPDLILNTFFKPPTG